MVNVDSVFARHPELLPTGKLSLLGEACCTAERMNEYVQRRNPLAPPIAEVFLSQGERYGIRGDVAYCQMVYETRCWTTQISGPAWSPWTLDQWSEEATIEGQMQILYTFATERPLPGQVSVTHRHLPWLERAGWKGNVPCWEDLNGRWSHQGNHHYGQDIIAIWRNMRMWRRKGKD